MYIAPLALEIDEYINLLNASFFNRTFTFNPFFHREIEVVIQSQRYSLGLCPFLRGHISIPPHEEVTTSNHHYSYSKSGADLAWHSGKKISGDFRLSAQIRQIFNASYNNPELGLSKGQFATFASDFLTSYKEPVTQEQDPEYIIRRFAYYLKQDYNIKLMLLKTN